MPTPPDLFDHTLLHQRRARAAAIGLADFLQAEISAEVAERLIEVNRTFTAPALVGGMPVWKTLGLQNLSVSGDDPVLALAPGAHDLVIHAQGLHWANDPVGQLVQAGHALQPDGMFIGTMFAGKTLHELRAALAEAEVEITGGLSPRVAPMGDLRDLGGLLQRAGFALPVADTVTLAVSYETPLHLMRDLRAMGETNVMTARHRVPLRRAILARACEYYVQTYSRPDGRINATFEVAFLTGWKPSHTQQQPLRPGSARTRLADALGVPEENAGDKAGG